MRKASYESQQHGRVGGRAKKAARPEPGVDLSYTSRAARDLGFGNGDVEAISLLIQYSVINGPLARPISLDDVTIDVWAYVNLTRNHPRFHGNLPRDVHAARLRIWGLLSTKYRKENGSVDYFCQPHRQVMRDVWLKSVVNDLLPRILHARDRASSRRP